MHSLALDQKIADLCSQVATLHPDDLSGGVTLGADLAGSPWPNDSLGQGVFAALTFSD